jgi:hypothetical protein
LQQRINSLEAEIFILKQQHVVQEERAKGIQTSSPSPPIFQVTDSQQPPTTVTSPTPSTTNTKAINVDKIATNKIVLYTDYLPTSSPISSPLRTQSSTTTNDTNRQRHFGQSSSTDVSPLKRNNNEFLNIESNVKKSALNSQEKVNVLKTRTIIQEQHHERREYSADKKLVESETVKLKNEATSVPSLVTPPPGWQWTPPKKQVYYFLHETPRHFPSSSSSPSSMTSESKTTPLLNTKLNTTKILLAQQYYLCFGCGKQLLVGNGIDSHPLSLSLSTSAFFCL